MTQNRIYEDYVLVWAQHAVKQYTYIYTCICIASTRGFSMNLLSFNFWIVWGRWEYAFSVEYPHRKKYPVDKSVIVLGSGYEQLVSIQLCLILLKLCHFRITETVHRSYRGECWIMSDNVLRFDCCPINLTWVTIYNM